MTEAKQNKIILLNGTSSSGKSSILKEFRKLRNDYEAFKVDDWFLIEVVQKAKELGWTEQLNTYPWAFLHTYLSKKTGKCYFDAELREELFMGDYLFYTTAKEAALKEKNVIIDTVLEYEKGYRRFFKVFKDFKVFKILVYCPLNILSQRVKERNKNPEEVRLTFLSFEQVPAIYKVQENKNEQIIDRIRSDIIKEALESAIQELINNGIPLAYLPKIEAFKRDFIKQFKLDEREEIILVARHAYDLILNSELKSPYQLALELSDLIRQR